VVARVPDGLPELLDRDLRRGQVRIAEAQIDDVLAGAPQLELQPVDDGEHVRRQCPDPAQIHTNEATPLDEPASVCIVRPVGGHELPLRIKRG
jgi:hypothetical protein